jgi:fumarate hydratase class II
MHVAAVIAIREQLIPQLNVLKKTSTKNRRRSVRSSKLAVHTFRMPRR